VFVHRLCAFLHYQIGTPLKLCTLRAVAHYNLLRLDLPSGPYLLFVHKFFICTMARELQTL
jgi:hypothetical protein